MGVAILVHNVMLVEPLNGVSVLHADEWPLWLFEAWVEGFDQFRHIRVCKELVNHSADDLLNVVEQVVEVDEIQLGFHMRVF